MHLICQILQQIHDNQRETPCQAIHLPNSILEHLKHSKQCPLINRLSPDPRVEPSAATHLCRDLGESAQSCVNSSGSAVQLRELAQVCKVAESCGGGLDSRFTTPSRKADESCRTPVNTTRRSKFSRVNVGTKAPAVGVPTRHAMATKKPMVPTRAPNFSTGVMVATNAGNNDTKQPNQCVASHVPHAGEARHTGRETVQCTE